MISLFLEILNLTGPFKKWDLNLKINKHLTGPSNDPISKSTILFLFRTASKFGDFGDSRRTTFFPKSHISNAQLRRLSQRVHFVFQSMEVNNRVCTIVSFFWSAKHVNIEWSNRELPVWGMVIPSWMGSPHNQNPHSATLRRQPTSPGLREKKGLAYCKEQGGYSEQVVAQQEKCFYMLWLKTNSI